MKVNELRIGNWVYLISKEKNYQISSGHDIEEIDDAPELFDATPIPLTEKWLTDFGFVKEGNLWHNQIALYVGNPEHPFNYDVCFFEHNNLVTVYHVHQLQNLYFALTGDELITSPTTPTPSE